MNALRTTSRCAFNGNISVQSEYIDERDALNIVSFTASGHIDETTMNGKKMSAQKIVLQNNTESTALPLSDFFLATS